jgi:hypothetical protein
MRKYYSMDVQVKVFEEWTGFGNSDHRSKANPRNGILNILQIMDNI